MCKKDINRPIRNMTQILAVLLKKYIFTVAIFKSSCLYFKVHNYVDLDMCNPYWKYINQDEFHAEVTLKNQRHVGAYYNSRIA